MHQREYLFGEVESDEMHCNSYGDIVAEEWMRIARLRTYVELDAFVVMPNHIHGIIAIVDEAGVGAQRAAPDAGVTPNNVTAHSLGAIVRAFKSAVARQINILRDTP